MVRPNPPEMPGATRTDDELLVDAIVLEIERRRITQEGSTRHFHQRQGVAWQAWIAPERAVPTICVYMIYTDASSVLGKVAKRYQQQGFVVTKNKSTRRRGTVWTSGVSLTVIP